MSALVGLETAKLVHAFEWGEGLAVVNPRMLSITVTASVQVSDGGKQMQLSMIAESRCKLEASGLYVMGVEPITVPFDLLYKKHEAIAKRELA